MHHSEPPLEQLTKSTLVTLSHAIERAALTVAEDGPLITFAMFQRLPYFERERAAYERIAGGSAVTVVGLVGDAPPVVGGTVRPVLLRDDEPLAREWSVVMLTPRVGAALVAYDRESVDPQASTLERGRLFDGRWSFRRDDALHEVVRLRGALADRLPTAALTAIDAALSRVRDLPAAPGESRIQATIGQLARAARREQRRTASLEQQLRQLRAEDAEATGIVDEPLLRRWLDADGTTASGTLPLAVVAVGLRRTEDQRVAGRRGSARELQTALKTLSTLLRPCDRAVRLGQDEFLLVMPGISQDDALAVAFRLHESIRLAAMDPFAPAGAHTVVTVTRDRPLPVPQLQQALQWATQEGVPVATLG